MELPINATGIIWNEQAKKPPLPDKALSAFSREASAPGLPWNDPGDEAVRALQPEKQLISLTGAEDALVLNNVFSAVFLIFLRLAKGAEVAALGGNPARQPGLSLLLDKLAARSGVQLRWIHGPSGPDSRELEAGSAPGLVLDMEEVAGSPGLQDPAAGESLLALAGEKGLPAVKLLQNAALMDLTPFGLNAGLQVQHWLQKGYDLVVFSGDSLIGGPPAGIILGRRRFVSLLREEFLAAAFHPGRMIAAALEATLSLYFQREKALEQIPLLRVISAPLSHLETRGEKLVQALNAAGQGQVRARMVRGKTAVRENHPALGQMATCQVELYSADFSARQLFDMMRRTGHPPVLAKLEEDRLLLDLRTVPEGEDEKLVASLQLALKEKNSEDRVLDSTPALIWALDDSGVFLYTNRACQRFWGLGPYAFPGRPVAEVLPRQAEPMEEALEMVRDSGEETSLELYVETTEGQRKWLDVALTPVFDERGNVHEVIFSAHDITRLKMTEEELKYITMHDSLTGLYNRAYFEEEMRRLDTQRHYPVSIVVFDVDGLKLINDILGHKQGDEHIKEAASIIKKPFRNSDVVARVGGDEFAVILPSTGEKTTEEICQRLKDTLQEHNRQQPGVPLSLSIGHATGEKPGGMSDVFEHADRNMYEDKFKHAEAVKKDVYQALTKLMAVKDFMDETGMKKLERLVLLLGRSIGISEDEMDLILLLARVHDIGKVSIDEDILYKQGTLSSEEWEEIMRHPEAGYRIASFSPDMKPVAEYILQHHECWDGSGYPRGLKGTDIHLYARILAIVDAYNAMTSPRPYREPLSHGEALQELIRMKGVQFDPRLVDIFVSLVDMEINALRDQN